MQLRTASPADLGGSEVVDTPSAQEFLVEIHRRATREQLDAIMADLQRKAALFASVLGPEALAGADARALRTVLERVFVTRRRVDALLGPHRATDVRERIAALLYGTAPLTERFDAFCVACDGLASPVAAELAAELLHFTAPDRWWLWTRWMWNPATRTGALPLVVADDEDLDVDGTGGATYARVGEAMRFLDSSPEAGSFRSGSGISPSLGTDLFLVGVYSVYMSTVLGLKLSKEFNAVVPALPELARRLLGVHRMEV